ncbi:discoidin domain-containing protein [Xanthocytophaga flava]|uniref:discoidin domain-containing protein n=1 Tax=Xanthocytophaga flava TaxID=3048013 RepID=UPI0028D2397F|nr:discoidin domain-containing protein [Xanthocytophaga flavus]MDJ1473283.1 discoidin domain-containing protein [Xanthocytophaga flavus]
MCLNLDRSSFYFILTLVLLIVNACQKAPEEKLKEVAEYAGENKKELLKVINHYQKPADSLKLKAAKFLIENMKGHASFAGDELKYVDVFSDSLHSMWKPENIIEIKSEDERENLIKNIVYTLNMGKRLEKLQVVEDIEIIKADYLIENIDLAFQAWQTYPWSKNVSFDDFCEYILPYKVYNEPLQSWRKEIMKEFAWIKDSIQYPVSLKQVTLLINKAVNNQMVYSPAMKNLPLAFSYSNLKKGRVGKCEHLMTYNTYILRAMGIPAMIDYVPLWGNNSSGHSWGAVKAENGVLFTFDALYPQPDSEQNSITNIIPEGILRNRKTPKIYRKNYSTHTTDEHPVRWLKINQIPAIFFDVNRIDVTSEYNVSITDFSFKPDSVIESEYTYLCVYNTNDWKIAAYGKRNTKGEYVFQNLGSDIVYLPVIYKNRSIIPISYPFLLLENNTIRRFKPDTNNCTILKINRKSFEDYELKIALTKMIGGIFQGATQKDFADSKAIFKIESKPVPKTNTYKITDQSYFRYLRFILPDQVCRVAQLQFYGIPRDSKGNTSSKEVLLTGNLISGEFKPGYEPKNIIDKNVLTYFVSTQEKGGFVGVDLGRNCFARITKIEFYPPNDGNSVEVGDLYELFYWDDGWKSLGKKNAVYEELVYNNGPENGLYRLKNLTKGYKERIFSYEKNIQIWW